MGQISLIFISLILFLETGFCSFNRVEPDSFHPNSEEKDTILERQILYNGKVWKNKYHYIDGNQFVLSELFLPGSISINNRTFNEVRIKYDIFSDEIIIPFDDDDIIQLNKEMVDSFSVEFEDKTYRFANITNDSLEGISGYVNVTYNGLSRFYVKYKKSISYFDTSKDNGQFDQNFKMYLVKDNVVRQISSKNDLINALGAEKKQMRDFTKESKLRISKKSPESFAAFIRFYENISQ